MIVIGLVRGSSTDEAAIRKSLPTGLVFEIALGVGTGATASHATDVILVRLEDVDRPTLDAFHRPRDVTCVIACNNTVGEFVAAIRPDVIVELAGIQHTLWPAIARVRAGRVLHHATSELVARISAPPALTRALRYAAEAGRPPRGVGELAAAIGCHRSTLTKQWKASAVGVSECCERLEDHVTFGLLVHAVALYRTDRSWSWAAERLGIHSHTLMRAAKRFAGIGLTQIAADPSAALAILERL